MVALIASAVYPPNGGVVPLPIVVSAATTDLALEKHTLEWFKSSKGHASQGRGQYRGAFTGQLNCVYGTRYDPLSNRGQNVDAVRCNSRH